MFEKETQIEERLTALAKRLYRKSVPECTDAQLYNCVLMLTKEALADRKVNEGKKKVYYISMEFLIGKLLSNNLINLGIYDQVASVLAKYGKNLSAIEEAERIVGLENLTWHLQNEESATNWGMCRTACAQVEDGLWLTVYIGLDDGQVHGLALDRCTLVDELPQEEPVNG